MPNTQPASTNRAVFLSYASQDGEAAKRICEALRSAGVEVWFDQNELVGGDPWDKKIRGQVASCALFVPVISANTQARLEGYFRIEWKLAAQRTHAMADAKPFLVPVVIDATNHADAHVPDEFRAAQWTYLHAGETNSAFCARIITLLSGEGAHLGKRHPESGSTLGGAAIPHPSAASPAHSAWPWLAPSLVFLALVVAGATFVTHRSHTGVEGAAKAVAEGPAAHVDPHSEVTALVDHVHRLNAKTDVLRAELDGAVGLMEQAVKIDPANAEAWAEWALIDARYLEEGLDQSRSRLDLAQRHATQAIELSPTSAAARLAKARAMTLASGDKATRAAAVKILEPLVDEPGDRAAALILLAKLKWNLGESEKASSYLDRAARTPGRSGQANYTRALEYLLTSLDCRRSEAEIDQALSAERAVKFLLWKSYLLLIWHGDVEGSMRMYAEVPPSMLLEDFPAGASYFAHLCAHDYEGAISALRSIPHDYIESGALTGPTGLYIGYALARQGKSAAAESEWRAALDVVTRRLANQPNDGSLIMFQAFLEKSLSHKAEAERLWRTLRELDEGITPWWEDYIVRLEFLPDNEAIDYLAELAKRGYTPGLAGSLRLSPFVDRLRSNPRFIALLATSDADPRLSPKANPASLTPSPVPKS